MDHDPDNDSIVRMASKRNSRVYSDEISYHDQKSAAATYRSRRNSRSSIKEDAMQAAKDAEEGQAQRGASAGRDTNTNSRSQNTVAAVKESIAKVSKNGDSVGKLT